MPPVSDSPAEEDRATLVKAFQGSQLSVDQLWLAYFALGGDVGRYEVEAYLAGLMPLDAHEHNVLAQAVNERLAELQPPPSAPYRSPEQHPSSGVSLQPGAGEEDDPD
jgi:hypothetical protein